MTSQERAAIVALQARDIDGLAALTKVARNQRDPLRVLPPLRLPARSWLPGHMPAHEARCAAEGNCPLSVPISASRTSAVSRL